MIFLKKICLYSIILIIIDQIVKVLITSNIDVNSSMEVINNFFKLTYVRNTGAAFSILEGNKIFLVIMAFIALIVIYYFMIHNKKLKKHETAIYTLLISGIIGNLIDRIVHSYVIDYFDFTLFNYEMPIFNIADTYIVFSCLCLIFITIKEEFYARNENRKTIGRTTNR